MSQYQQPLNQNAHIQSLIIVGGGSAGWMTAAMLAKQLGSSIKITLVESEQIGTIGVGEATIPPIQNFNRLLGIDENEFLSFCNGSIKLAIQFENWRHKDHRYMHPFGSFGVDFDYMSFPYFWLKDTLTKKAAGQSYKELEEYSIAWHLAENNKFQQPDKDPSSLGSRYDYAFHFDASRYAEFLRQFSENLGVTRHEGKITQVNTSNDTGYISSIELESGETLSADFFIDCSGQRALLLGDTLGVEFDSWSKWLLNDRAVAIQTAHMKSVSPYTRSIAHHAGWQWRIPLQTRMGNGNVYSSQHMTDEEALKTLLNSVEGPTITEPNFIKFRTGKRQQVWKHNCLAIGLSAGFLEPLESTSLHLIQTAIMRLVRLFPTKQVSEQLIKTYNNEAQNEYEMIRDFIILHYKATERDDSEYWRYCQSMSLPKSLEERLALYKEHGHLIIHDKELFKQENWMAVLAGQNLLPEGVGPVVAAKNELDIDKSFDAIHKNMKKFAYSAKSHEMYLMQTCPFKG